MVKITSEGWTIEQDCPILFNRTPNISPMPEPVRGGSLAELRPLLNITDADWPWIVAFMLTALSPHGPYVHLVLYGPSGSTKSTQARFIAGAIDSTWDTKRQREQLFEPPKTSEDLMVFAISSWLLAFDNIRTIPDKLSDALCRLSTGGAFITRKLYTNNGLAKMEAQQPTILTMVYDCTKDLADLRTRCFFRALQLLPDEAMTGEVELQGRFNAVQPRIMGALFDCVVSALKNFETTKAAPGNRMADMTRWCIAAEPATGLPPGTFLQIFTPVRPPKTLNDALRALADEGAGEGVILEAKQIFDRMTVMELSDRPKNSMSLSALLRSAKLEGVSITKVGKRWKIARK